MLKKLSYPEIEKSLKNNYYYSVPFPIAKTVIHRAVDAYFTFLKQAEDVKNTIQFTVNPESRRGDVGFVHRDPKDSIYNDSKEYFHFHAAIFDRYPDFLKKNPTVQDFAEKALPIWNAAKSTVTGIFKCFEPSFPGITGRFFNSKEPEILLRFLKYNWTHAGKYLAKPHYDAGSCTLAIAESAPGLRIGKCDDSLRLVEHTPGEALFMMSKNFPKMTNCSFIPSWHDVVQTDETLIDKAYARWAVVCFFEAEGMVAEPREETRKALAKS
jgi:hypothetical protein